MGDSDQKDRPLASAKRGRFAHAIWMVSLFFQYLYDTLLEAVASDWKVFKREARIFVGTAFVILGVFGFESGKYCDGNTADYLSCTRPSTYYYFDNLDILLIVLGSFLIIVWFITPRGKGK